LDIKMRNKREGGRGIVRMKIAAFRRQSFRVNVISTPASSIIIEDDHRVYLTLTYSDAAAFIAVSHELARLHALSLADACRLQGFRALQAHLQIEIPLDETTHRGWLHESMDLRSVT
jgi:hypothetical protein